MWLIIEGHLLEQWIHVNLVGGDLGYGNSTRAGLLIEAAGAGSRLCGVDFCKLGEKKV